MDEVGKAVRDAAITQMAEGLLALGIPKSKVEAAKAEARKQNSDKPLLELTRGISFLRRGGRQ